MSKALLKSYAQATSLFTSADPYYVEFQVWLTEEQRIC